jgi:subtilisin-like proprotein convertase family protein
MCYFLAENLVSGDNLGNPATCPNALFTLQAGGAALTTTNTNNVVGVFQPEESFNLFNDGSNANGVWVLAVCDNGALDVGALRYIKLSFTDLCADFAADAGVDVDICEGESATLTATGGGTYLWSTTETTASITVTPLANETYSVTVTDGNSCSLTDTDDVTVTVNDFPVADAGVDQIICSGETATLTATGGGTYLWSTGETTASIEVTPLVNITYTVTVEGAGGCTATANVAVTVNTTPVADAGNDVLICIGDDVTLTATGGGDYEWSNGETTASITVSPVTATTYTVTVTAANSCTASADVFVDVNTLAPGLAGVDQEICLGESATLTATGGNDYEWSNGETTAGITVMPTVNATYTVTITVSGGCTTTDDVAVTVNALPVADAGADEEICPGETVTLTATGGIDYEWSTSETTVDITVSPLVNTTYTVVVTDGNGCSATADVTVDLFPAVNAYAGQGITICPLAIGTLTASGGVDYLWTTGETTASIEVDPLVNTTYTVTVTDANGCSATDDVLVTVVYTNLTTTANAATYCEGENILINSVTALRFAGSNNTPLAIPDGSTVGVTSVINLNATGNIVPTNVVTVTLNVTHGWIEDIDAFLVGPGNCGTLLLTSDNGGSGDNYSNTVLTTAATNVIGSTGNNTPPFTGTYRPEGTITTAPVLTGAAGGGTYTLPNTAINGCPINGAWTLRMYDDDPLFTGSLLNWSLEISEPTEVYASHVISGAGTITSTTSGANAFLSATVTNAPAGENEYIATIVDLNGCTTYDTVTVKVYGKPEITAITQTCTVADDASITVQATLDNGNFSGSDVGNIEYSFDGGSTWGITNTITDLSAGTYQIALRNDANFGCVTTTSVTITSPPTVAATNSSPGCEGQDFAINTLASGGTVAASSSGTNNTSSAIPDGSLLGTSSSIALSGSGNIIASTVVTVTLNITHAFISDVDVYLVGPNGCGTLELTTDNGGTGSNYTNTVLSTSATNPVTAGTAPFTNTYRPEGSVTVAPNLASGVGGGTYNLPATAINGCPVSGNWTLRVYDDDALVSGTLTGWTLNITENAQYIQTVTGSGVIGAASYSGTNSEVANFIVSDAPIGENVYTVTVTDDNGCEGSTTTIVKVFDTPSNVTVTATCAGPLGGSITVTADAINNANFTGSDFGDLEYSYDGGSSWNINNVETSLSSGVYQVYVRNSANPICQAGPFTVTVFEAPTVVVNDPELCAGATVDLIATSPNTVTYEWSTSEATQTITVNADGDYYVTVTDGNGCTATDTATVTPGTSLTVNLADYEFCDGNTVVLDASNPGAVYVWSTGATTQTITVGNSDTYSVTVTASACTGTASSEVVVNPNPTDNLADAEICDGDVLTLDAGNAGDDFVWSTGETTQTIDVTTANTYSVTITNQFTCSIVSDATIAVNALPLVNLQDAEVCAGTVVTLDAENIGSTYVWSPNGETTQTIVANATDSYSVTVTDANGCSSTSAADVIVNANPVVNITGNTTICEGETAVLFGSGTGDYLWSNGETTVAISVTPSVNTDYELTVSDANGCSATDDVTVVVNANPAASITGDLTPCSTTGTTLTAGGGVDYEWNTGAVTAAITVTPQLATVYSVTVTAQNGCTDTESVTVIPVGVQLPMQAQM